MVRPAEHIEESRDSRRTLPVYSGAIVCAPEGRILCQLRDDKPGILFPGYWTCSPGGHVEPGEAPEKAIVRELREEFEIEVTGLQPLKTLVREDGYAPGIYHSFTATLATPLDQVKCNEGQKVDFFRPEEIRRMRIHPISMEFLETWLAGTGTDGTNLAKPIEGQPL